MKYLIFISIMFALPLMSCEENEPEPISGGGSSNTNNEWLIPSNQIYDGGPGKDGIPALENIEFQSTSSSEHNYLSDEDLVLVIHSGNQTKAYPHKILDWHEIINDQLDTLTHSVNYCPLTGTGMAWNRIINGVETTFGVSGLLYNTNLMPYDRLTDSYWSQMELMSVRGEKAGEDAEIYSMIEMRWATFKNLFSDGLVAIPPKNYNRPYQSYPYGNYKTDNELFLFPVDRSDQRLPAKERVLALIGDKVNAKVYRFSNIQGEPVFIKDRFFFKNYVISGIGDDFLVAFETVTHSGDTINPEAVVGKLPILLKDETGSEWDLTGKAVTGPHSGKQLKMATFINGFWFTFPAFFESVNIYGQEENR